MLEFQSYNVKMYDLTFAYVEVQIRIENKKCVTLHLHHYGTDTIIAETTVQEINEKLTERELFYWAMTAYGKWFNNEMHVAIDQNRGNDIEV